MSRDGLMVLKATARAASHGGVAGGRSQKCLHATLGTSGVNGADGGGSLGADREPKERSDADGPRVHDGAAATTPPRWK